MELVGDLGCGELGGQVAQHPDFALAERLEQAPLHCPLVAVRCRGLPPGQRVKDLGDLGGVGGAQPAVCVEQPRRGVFQEREQQAFRLGEIEGALQGAPRGARIAERVAADRLERLLIETDLRLVILDPNSEFVRLGKVRGGADPALAERYQEAARGVAVYSADAPGERRLRLHAAEIDPATQAAVLRLDPIADR